MDASAIALARDKQPAIIVFSLGRAGRVKGFSAGEGTYTRVQELTPTYDRCPFWGPPPFFYTKRARSALFGQIFRIVTKPPGTSCQDDFIADTDDLEAAHERRDCVRCVTEFASLSTGRRGRALHAGAD